MGKLKEIREKRVKFHSENDPILIAGPCSAETREQVLESAHLLAKNGLSFFRAGIWKPRTRPDSFEGVGEIGLSWLQEAKKQYGIRPATEVANARHVELALAYDIDLVWIGARTSVNPFAVQEIADALKGTHIPVMVKNPINPDLELWIGALERMQRAGIEKVMACHRGFNVYGHSVYRNAPLWEIPVELKRRMPEIPLLCDPSHIAGKREYISSIVTKAVNIGYEGLMIESHPNPDQAWSDPKQQLKPADLLQLLDQLEFKKRYSDNAEFINELNYLRDEVTQVDARLLNLLGERMEVSRRIGALKKENNVAFYESNRWNQIIEFVKENSQNLHLNEEFALKLFSLLHMESIDIQGE